MKKILFLLAFAIGFISCNDEKHVWSFEDMFYFLHNDPSQEGWVEPVTKITVGPGAQVDLLVTRNAFAAKAHPKQTVKVIVEENLSTAKPGGDFILSEQVFNFRNKDVLQLPLRVTISGGTSGKKIVLRLDYGYYDECSPESRKGDKLIIKVK